MNRKRYCIFAAQYFPHLGGVERYTYNLAKKLIEDGNEVVIVTSNVYKLPALFKHWHTVYFNNKRNYHNKPHKRFCYNNSRISHNRNKRCGYYNLSYHLKRAWYKRRNVFAKSLHCISYYTDNCRDIVKYSVKLKIISSIYNNSIITCLLYTSPSPRDTR